MKLHTTKLYFLNKSIKIHVEQKWTHTQITLMNELLFIEWYGLYNSENIELCYDIFIRT